MSDLDNAMDVINSLEEKKRAADAPQRGAGRVRVGSVEHYYEKLGVAAIKLDETLRVGDLIEIGDEDDAVRQRVSSMQINREDVSEAYAGDSIGIKTRHTVYEGSDVYRL